MKYMTKVKLGDVAIEQKQTYKGNKNNIPSVGLEHLTPSEVRLSRWDMNVDNTFTKGFTKGQILLGRRRAYLKKAVIAPFDGICSGDITVIEAIPNKIREDLLPFIIQNDRFFDYASRGSAGSLSPRVKWEYLKEYEFYLPPIEEQERLAKLLWAAYELKESYKKLIVAIDEMVKAQFIEMFGDPAINSKKLPSKTGNSIFEFSSGKANTKSNLSNEFTYECYGGNGITGYSSAYLIEEKTIVIGRVGEYCGSVHITNGFSWITDNAIYLKSYDKILYDFDFIYYLFLFIDLNRFSSRSGQPKITQAPLLSMEYILPSIEKQIEFVQIAQQADKSKAELQQSIQKIDNVMKSLLP